MKTNSTKLLVNVNSQSYKQISLNLRKFDVFEKKRGKWKQTENNYIKVLYESRTWQGYFKHFAKYNALQYNEKLPLFL